MIFGYARVSTDGQTLDAQRADIREGLRVMGVRRHATIAFMVEAERVVIHGILGRGQDVNRLFEDEGE